MRPVVPSDNTGDSSTSNNKRSYNKRATLLRSTTTATATLISTFIDHHHRQHQQHHNSHSSRFMATQGNNGCKAYEDDDDGDGDYDQESRQERGTRIAIASHQRIKQLIDRRSSRRAAIKTNDMNSLQNKPATTTNNNNNNARKTIVTPIPTTITTSSSSNGSSIIPTLIIPNSHRQCKSYLVVLSIVLAAITLLTSGYGGSGHRLVLAAPTTNTGSGSNSNSNDESSPIANGNTKAADGTRAALEAELNSILQQDQAQQQQQQQQDTTNNNKLMSEAIIARLMLGNMSDINESDLDGGPPPAVVAGNAAVQQSDGTGASSAADEQVVLSGPDSVRLRKLLSYLQSYEMMKQGESDGGGGGGLNGGQVFDQYPVLPASQAATIKRASMKVGNYLRAQQQQPHAGQRQLNGYGRVNSFDFGLGKRPDSSVSNNILRLGDSSGVGGHMATVSGASGLGKRPSAHRFDFGLGKRVASPAYPRYDFGLGKRAPSRVRYDFGLGKK